MFKHLLHIIIIFSLFNLSISQSIEYKLTKYQIKAIKQAKSFEATGLIIQAKNIYLDILKESPYIDEAYKSLINIYMMNNNLDDLVTVTDKYIEAHNNSANKIINVFETYILTDMEKVNTIIKNITKSKDIDIQYLSKLCAILLHNEKENIVIDIVKDIRSNTTNKDFYSLQLGMFYSLNQLINKALEEYLIFLNNNNSQIHIISNRIMFLADNEANVNLIKNILDQSNLIESKLILSELEFKIQNYDESYELLKKYSTNEKIIITFIEDLIDVRNFDLAQNVINDILTSSKNQYILKEAIFNLAQLFELQLTKNSNLLPISTIINNNEITDSPFIHFEEQYSNLLNKAINIYDSLSINLNDYKSTYHLANIKYQILGDFDGAKILYQNVYNNSTSLEYKKLALKNIIDINISKGDLENAEIEIQKYYKNNNKELKNILDVKKIQTYFYNANKDSLIFYCNQVLKTLPKEYPLYNDILDILSITYLINDDDDFMNYTKSKFKLIQNKRIQTINLLESINSNHIEVNDRIKYENSYLYVQHGDYNKALNIINNFNKNSAYNEYAVLLKGEIYDYLLNDKSQAVDIYLLFLDLFPNSIYYDLIRLRLRELAL